MTRRRSMVIAAVMVCAIIINVIQFPRIDQQRLQEFKAIGRYDTADIAAISYLACDWCRERYGLYLALGVVAPGAKVIIPTSYAPDRVTADEIASRLRVFARVDSVAWAPTATASGPGLEPAPYVIASGAGGRMGGPWALAVDPMDLPAAGSRDPDAFLDDVVTGEGARRSETVREFALLRWERPRPGSAYAYQELLIETVLLPPDVRARLTG